MRGPGGWLRNRLNFVRYRRNIYLTFVYLRSRAARRTEGLWYAATAVTPSCGNVT